MQFASYCKLRVGYLDLMNVAEDWIFYNDGLNDGWNRVFNQMNHWPLNSATNHHTSILRLLCRVLSNNLRILFVVVCHAAC